MTNFQFSIFNQFPISKFSKKHILKMGLVSLTAITVGVVIGLVLNYQTLKTLRSEPVESTPPPGDGGWSQAEKPEEKIATYSGTIKPLGPSIYMEGTHYLENEDGEMILLLKSPKIDLGLIEGWEVEVEGEVGETVEGGKKIMEVEEVRL